MPNPCGLSYEKTLEIIKDKVIGAKQNGRQEIMFSLQKEGYSYGEAKEVADTYFKLYKNASNQMLTKKPLILLSAEQKKQQKINRLGMAYLNGEIVSYPLTREDEHHLLGLYQKMDSAETPSLKQRYNEEASVFVRKHLPNYSDEIFKSGVYNLPLLSADFFVKSLQSNFWGQIERSISNTLWDGNKMDFNQLWKFEGLANSAFKSVLKGGIPATSLYQQETHTHYQGRTEEFDLKGTDAEGKEYYQAFNFISKWSARLNSSPDTRGIYSNAERHFFQLSKEYYRDAGFSDNEATQKSLEDMELRDRNVATQMAIDKFNELRLEPFNEKGNPTSELKVAIAEYQRANRDEHLWSRALDLAKDDFWKKNMTVKSELGFGDTGLFGLQARAMTAFRDALPKGGKLSSVLSFASFGFINGSANFAEDALERMPLYGAVKVALLQRAKGKTNDTELANDIARRQKDIIVKNVVTALFFAMAKTLESVVCPQRKDKVGSSDISSSRTQIGICGIPLLVPFQMMPMYKVYSILSNAFRNDEDFFQTSLNVLPVLIQSNDMGLSGGFEKMEKHGLNYTAAAAQGNELRQQEEGYKFIKEAVNTATGVANSFIPFPSRLAKEGSTAVQAARGINQKQQELPFAIDELGTPRSRWNTLGNMIVSSMGNVTGVSEIIIAAAGSNKTYAVDWQGRTVAHLRGSDLTGSGIQYNANDDILAQAAIKAPYVNRMEKIKVDSESEYKHVLDQRLKITKETDRYLTDEEFFDISVALGNFNKNYFEEKHDKIIAAVKKDKKEAKKVLLNVFDHTKKAAIEAVEKGYTGEKSIEAYIKHHWETGKTQGITEKSN